MIWWALAAAVVVWLFFLRAGRDAAGGGLTIGFLVGIGIAAFQPHFLWSTVGKAMIVGAIIGIAAELLPLISRLWQR